MTKKQPDFQKTKLRVGKQLPKGRNVTDTSFKTRKIVVQSQLKDSPGEISLKDLLNHLGHNNVSTKKDYLHKLNIYVREKKDTLFLHFPDILKRIGRILLENDAGVREIAITVLHTCLKLLSESQIKCFFPTLALYLNSMMTHCNNSIRKDSLKLLDKVLDTSPHVISDSVHVFSSLLNMISSVVQETTKTKGKLKRKLDELISSKITSQGWRIEVLSRVQLFLKGMLEDGNISKEAEEKNVVHWDGNQPLYLPLYLRGGLKPLKLEDLEALSGSTTKEKNKEFIQFVYDLIPLLSEIIKSEISSKQNQSSGSFNAVESSVFKLLNVVSHILCSIGEWMSKNPNFQEEKDPEFDQFVCKTVCLQLFKGFPYSVHDSSVNVKYIKKMNMKKVEVECMQLNLSICYLYCMFVLDTKYASCKMEELIMTYLKDVFRISNKVCDESISEILVISKLLIKSKNIKESYKDGILLSLHGILSDGKYSPYSDSLYSFFMDVSLNYDLNHLLKCDGMKQWLGMILPEMEFMMKKDLVNKKFLKYVQQVSSRKYAYFMERLNQLETKVFIDLLKYDDEEFQITVIQLICSLDTIDRNFLQDLVNTMSDVSFSLNSASRLIRLLHARFSGQNVKETDKVIFVKFLLNLATDMNVILDPAFVESTHTSPILMDMLQGCGFEVMPSEKAKRHFKIADVCFDCLSSWLRNSHLAQHTMCFIQEVLHEYHKFPVHFVIAFLQLRNELKSLYDIEELDGPFYDMIYSCLMYLSVITENQIDGPGYCISEVKKNLHLQRRDLHGIVSTISTAIDLSGERELYHILRMIRVFIKEELFTYADGQLVYSLVQKIDAICPHSEYLLPLCMTLIKFYQTV